MIWQDQLKSKKKTQKGINEKRKKSVKQNAKQAAVSITKRLLFCLKWTDDDQKQHILFLLFLFQNTGQLLGIFYLPF